MEPRNDRLVVDGSYLLARSDTVRYSAQRATKSLFGSMTSGEWFVRLYEGSGTFLIAHIPYWRQRLFAAVTHARAAKSAAGD